MARSRLARGPAARRTRPRSRRPPTFQMSSRRPAIVQWFGETPRCDYPSQRSRGALRESPPPDRPMPPTLAPPPVALVLLEGPAGARDPPLSSVAERGDDPVVRSNCAPGRPLRRRRRRPRGDGGAGRTREETGVDLFGTRERLGALDDLYPRHIGPAPRGGAALRLCVDPTRRPRYER